MLGHLGAMLGLCWATLGPSWAYVGPMLGLCWAIRLGDRGAKLGLCWAILGPCWAYVGRSWGHVGPMLGDLGAILGLCWAYVGPSWGSSWARLGHLGAQRGPSRDEKSGFVEEQKTAKNTANCGTTPRSAAGARSPIAKASGLRPGALPIDRACWPDLSAYARQPARGPTMLAHLMAMLAYVGLMLTHFEPKDPENGNSKKTL